MTKTGTKASGIIALAAAAVLSMGALMGTPASAYADPSSAEIQAQAQSALASLNAMSASLDEASNTYYAALSEVESAQGKMDEAQAKINEENKHIAELQGQLSTRARSMYRSGSTSFLDVLLGSSTWEAFTSNWDILTNMNANDAQLVGETKESRQVLEASKAEFSEQKDIAQAKTDEAAVTKAQAEQTVAEMQALYDNLSAEAAAVLEQERAAQAAAEAAQAQATVEAAANNSGDYSSGGSSDGGSTSGGGGSYSEPAYVAATGNAVVDRGMSYVGNAQYVWGACSPGAFDCSGFVSYCLTGSYSRLGTTYTFLGWPHVSDPQPGDVAVNANHTGIYIGGGQMVHCATYGVGVIVGPVQSGMVFVRY